MIQADFDGACEPRNPGGHGAFGAIVRVDDKVVYRNAGYCGCGPTISNNVAEYCGVIDALTAAVKYEGVVTLRGDSKLVIMQLGPDQRFGRKRWKAKHGLYLPFYEQAIVLANFYRDRLRFTWIPRSQNTECDVLSKEVLAERGIRITSERADRNIRFLAPK
jgi:ribonuclease HI